MLLISAEMTAHLISLKSKNKNLNVCRFMRIEKLIKTHCRFLQCVFLMQSGKVNTDFEENCIDKNQALY